MQTPLQKYPPQHARCLYFDANGNKVSQPSRNTTPTYDPWRALEELQKQHDPTR